MKLIAYTYETPEALQAFVAKHFHANDHLLIQMFCGDSDRFKISSILHFLKSQFSNSVIIGASTAGEIKAGCVQTGTIQIGFCHLEKSMAKAYYFPEVTFEEGEKAASSIIQKETKVCIALAHPFGKKNDSENFIEGFNSIHAEIPLVGGNAADAFLFQNAFVIYEDQLLDRGIVLVSLSGKKLHVNSAYSLAWTQIGKELTVTKAHNGTLYEIDHRPVQEVYKQYLGKDILQNLPGSAMEFPFVKSCDGIEICRSLIGINEDGSLVFSGHLKEGDKVHFSIGNIEDVIDKAVVMQAEINEKPAEAIFIYSCSARQLYLKDQLNYECELLEQIAPTVGFLTYGEFFHSRNKNQLLNVTTTALSLSESDYIVSHALVEKPEVHSSTLKSLTHLVNATQRELDESINFLNQYKMILDESSIVTKMDLQGVITYANQALCTLSGYTKEELIGANHAMFRTPDADINIYTNL